MHKSELSTAVIDCQTNDLTEATRFWSAALGRKVDASETTVSMPCATCERWAVLDLERLIAEGRVDYCSSVGNRAIATAADGGSGNVPRRAAAIAVRS